MNAFPKLDLTTTRSSADQQQHLLRQAQELVKSIKDPCSPRIGLLTPLPNASVATKHITWGGIKGVKSSIKSKNEHYVSCSRADSIKVKDIISDRGTPCSIANGVSSIQGLVRLGNSSCLQDKQAAPEFISLFEQQKSKLSRGTARMVKNSSGNYTIIKTKPSSCHIHLPSVHTELETSEWHTLRDTACMYMYYIYYIFCIVSSERYTHPTTQKKLLNQNTHTNNTF